MTRVWIHPLTWLIALMPFGWITLAKAGGFSINLPYLPAFALIVTAAAAPMILFGLARVVQWHGLWLGAYGFYLLLLAIALMGSPGQGIFFRQVFFTTTFLAVAASFCTHHRPDRVARIGGGIALLLVIVVVEILARRIGLSWADAILRFATSGDLNFLIYDFFRGVFNALGDSGDITVGAAAKNALAVAVLTAGFLFRAGNDREQTDWVGRFVLAIVLGLLVMLNTRSVLLMALVSVPLASWITTIRRGGQTLGVLIAKTFLALTAAVALLTLLTSDNALVRLLEERFSFSDASAGSRFDQYAWALGRIETNILTGSGYGEIDGHPVHNLFLGAWMHAGVLAFALVVIFYLGLIIVWGRFVLALVTLPDYWQLPMRAEWVAVLPLVGFFRVWLSGDAGHLIFVEWITLGCFIGLLGANRLARRAEITLDLNEQEITP